MKIQCLNVIRQEVRIGYHGHFFGQQVITVLNKKIIQIRKIFLRYTYNQAMCVLSCKSH